MYKIKQRFGGSLTLHDNDGQAAEALATERALNKRTKAGKPESVRIYRKSDPLSTRNLIYSTERLEM